jgi:hypothetical protein
MREIEEPDWKVLRRVHPLALERFCERVLAEIDRASHITESILPIRFWRIGRIAARAPLAGKGAALT